MPPGIAVDAVGLLLADQVHMTRNSLTPGERLLELDSLSPGRREAMSQHWSAASPCNLHKWQCNILVAFIILRSLLTGVSMP
jgi:hypothetical protein